MDNFFNHVQNRNNLVSDDLKSTCDIVIDVGNIGGNLVVTFGKEKMTQ